VYSHLVFWQSQYQSSSYSVCIWLKMYILTASNLAPPAHVHQRFGCIHYER